MNVRPILFSAFLLVITGATPKQGVVLKMAGSVGDTATFHSITTFDFNGQDGSVELTRGWEVKEVSDAGDVTILSESKEASVIVAGQEVQQEFFPTFTVKYSPKGEVLDLSGDGPLDVVAPNVKLQTVHYSESPVDVGGTWTSERYSEENGVKNGWSYKYKVEAAEKIGDIDTWKVSCDGKVTVNGQEMINKGTVWINPKNGWVEKADSEWGNVMTPAGPLDMHFTMSRG